MAIALGKRKRETKTICSKPKPRARSPNANGDEDADARKAFQQAFEAKFKPLENIPKRPVTENGPQSDEEDDVLDDEESDWSGFAVDENEIEIVEHANSSIADVDARDEDKGHFMSSKPPTSTQASITSSKPTKARAEGDEGDDATNLKHDIALQRLLKESHLLDATSMHHTAPEGKNRLQALDMRLQNLGAKSSVLQQDKMPMSHRKGINLKSSSREASRRKNAAENGIILEKAKLAAKPQKRRERGIGAPGVGKFRGGTLKLSARDVKSIQDSGEGRRGSKGRRR